MGNPGQHQTRGRVGGFEFVTVQCIAELAANKGLAIWVLLACNGLKPGV